jgi:hypothetical protein
MSIEIVSALLSPTVVSSAVAGVAKGLYEFVKSEYREKGVRIDVGNLKGSDVDTIRKTIGSALPENEERKITISALNEARNSTVAVRLERMRQAKLAFNAAVALLVVGVLIILLGIALMILKDNSAGAAITTAVGATVEVISALLFKFNSETNNRLDETGKYLYRIEAAQLAMNIASKIEDRAKRDDGIREAVLALSKT